MQTEWSYVYVHPRNSSNLTTCMFLRVSKHYVFQQRYFAAAFGVYGVGHQIEVRGRQKIRHGDPKDRQVGRHTGRVHPKVAGQHLIRFQPELLMQAAVISRHAFDLQDFRALIERRFYRAIVQRIRFHCADTFSLRNNLVAQVAFAIKLKKSSD